MARSSAAAQLHIPKGHATLKSDKPRFRIVSWASSAAAYTAGDSTIPQPPCSRSSCLCMDHQLPTSCRDSSRSIWTTNSIRELLASHTESPCAAAAPSTKQQQQGVSRPRQASKHLEETMTQEKARGYQEGPKGSVAQARRHRRGKKALWKTTEDTLKGKMTRLSLQKTTRHHR